MLIVNATNVTGGNGTREDGTADYVARVAINDRTIWAGSVKGHVRDSGAAKLLRLLANAMEPLVACGVKVMGNMVWFMDTDEAPRQVSSLERKLIEALTAAGENYAVVHNANAVLSAHLGNLLKDGIEYGIGEHDMCACRYCGRRGHNDFIGHQFGIVHTDNCPWLAARKGIKA